MMTLTTKQKLTDYERLKKDYLKVTDANAELLEALNNLYGAVDAVGYVNTTIIHPAMLNARRAIRKAGR